MKRILFSIWFTGLCGLFPINGWTAPTIYSAPSSVYDGQSIVISGTEFGIKTPAKPYLWAPFNGSLNPSSLGLKTSWSGNENMFYAAGEGVSGGAAKGVVGSADGYGPPWTLRIDSDGFNWNDLGLSIYVYRKTKENFDIGSINWKILRAWNATSPFNNFYISPNGASGAEYTTLQTSNWFQDRTTAKGSANRWRIEEFIQKSNSTTSTTDGSVQWFTDSILTFYVPSAGCTWLINDGRGPITRLFPIHGVEANSWSTFAGTNRAHWADDVYVDKTWARVMIGNKPTWTECTHKEIQIPQSWNSDGSSIGIVVNKGSFVVGESGYLYVIDKDGHFSNGYKITFASPSAAPAQINTLNKKSAMP